MSFESQIVTALASVAATATGGIHTMDSTGRLGITRTTVPSAFTSGIIKPCILVKQRETILLPDLHDTLPPLQSAKTVIELWFYQDSGYATIETMRNAVFPLLHGKQLDGAFQMFWVGDVRNNYRDTAIDASVERSDYELYLIRR